MLQAVEGVGRNWHVACEVVSCAAAALTLLVRRLPHPHPHLHHLLHLFLESPKVPCARVGCHTTTVSQIGSPDWITYVGISRQGLLNVSGGKLVQLLVMTEDDDCDIYRTQHRQLVRFLEEAALSLEESSAVVSADRSECFVRLTLIDFDRP
jgi:hypothetical protein